MPAHIYFRNVSQGQRVIEALWKAVKQYWKTAMIGDPLAAPFSLPSGGGSTSCGWTWPSALLLRATLKRRQEFPR